eukprot:gene35644-43231_t
MASYGRWVVWKIFLAACIFLVTTDLHGLLAGSIVYGATNIGRTSRTYLFSVAADVSTSEDPVEGDYVDESEQASSAQIEETSQGPLSPMEKLLGQSLYVWGDAEPDEQGNAQRGIYESHTSELLKGKKYVALYFSASWCPPCRQFTPSLVKFYTVAQKAKKGLEIIWVSGDRSQDEFVGYYQKMPWLAVPMDKAGAYMQSLGAKYQLKGIPHLVLLDMDGNVLSLDMRTQVLKDPHALQFPWRGPSLSGLSSLIPKSFKTYLENRVYSLKQSIVQMIKGALQAWLPPQVLKLIFR